MSVYDVAAVDRLSSLHKRSGSNGNGNGGSKSSSRSSSHSSGSRGGAGKLDSLSSGGCHVTQSDGSRGSNPGTAITTPSLQRTKSRGVVSSSPLSPSSTLSPPPRQMSGGGGGRGSPISPFARRREHDGSFSPMVSRDAKSDKIKESFAKYQASLSRPDSPNSRFNDDIPSFNRYHQAPCRRPEPQLPSFRRTEAPMPSFRPPESANFRSDKTERNLEHPREEYVTGASSDPSSRLWETLPTRRPSEKRDSFYEEEQINMMESRYPYLSTPGSVSSLPRNTKLLKMNQKFAETIRESENILARSSQNLAAMESRETLLKRYPSQSPRGSTRASPTVLSPNRSLRASPVKSPLRSLRASPTNSLRSSPSCSRRSSPVRRSSLMISPYMSPVSSLKRHVHHQEDPSLYDQYHHHYNYQPSHHQHHPHQVEAYHDYHSRDPRMSPCGTLQDPRMSPCSTPRGPTMSPCRGGGSACSTPRCQSRPTSPHQIINSPCCSHRSSRNSSPSRTYASHYGDQYGCSSHLQSHGEEQSGCSCHHCSSVLPPAPTAPGRNWCQPAHQPYHHYYSSVPGTPTLSRASSRAASPSRTKQDDRMAGPGEVSRKLGKDPRSRTPSEVSSAGPSVSVRASRASSRAASPPQHSSAASSASDRYENIVQVVSPQKHGVQVSGGGPCLMYVRETFQIVGSNQIVSTEGQISPYDIIRSLSGGSMPHSLGHSIHTSPQREGSDVGDNKKTNNNTQDQQSFDEKSEVNSKLSTGDGQTDRQTCHGVDIQQLDNQPLPLSTGSLDKASIQSIEHFLASIRNSKERNIGKNDEIENSFEPQQVLEDLDDSGRAESIVSGTSFSSVRSPELPGTISPNNTSNHSFERPGSGLENVMQVDPHSTIRRQSVIIEGLSLEADDLKRKVQKLEDELSSVPVVNEIQNKLHQMESKLEETETFAYQVVEENVTLKSEIEALESEISEVQDTFRENDAKEFKRVKWELENLAKSCRNLQLKLGKTQSKANRLRAEKEALEAKKREERFLWKKTAVLAAAIIAGLHILSGKMK